MLKNEDIKLMHKILKSIDRDITNEENKLLNKLDIIVAQISIMEESQEKMTKLQDRLVELEKGE